MLERAFLALALSTALVACGGDSNSDGENGGQGNAGGSGGNTGGSGGTGNVAGVSGGGGVGNVGGTSFSVDIGPIDVSPGVERTQCVIKRLGNPAGFQVGLIQNQISSSSHHLIVYTTNDTEEKTQPFDCDPFVETLDPSKGAPVMITQKYDDHLQLPKGVAYTFQENQMIRLELHYINTQPGAEQVTAKSTFTSIPEGQYEHEAAFLFTGNIDISIPANSSHTLGPTYFPMPQELGGSKIFAITGHEHRFGTDVYVEMAGSQNDPGTPIYDVENFLWDEPETVIHEPPVELPNGGGFRFTCEWNNTSKSQVGFGESANSEMCFFWAYYYPSKGSKVCFYSEQFGFPISDCCPGGSLCSQLGF